MSSNNVILAVPLAQMNNTESLNHHKAEYANFVKAGIPEIQAGKVVFIPELVIVKNNYFENFNRF